MPSRVNVTFEGTKESFKTAITKVDLKSRAFAFDKLVPDNGNTYIRQGKKMKIMADFRGIL